ncbi:MULTISPECIES: DUF6328 family protein [unclassified Kitasatospora]|uniref:DUF6328 family protein n=1 Tax=unclassified Kitasatospora TaxID=2633591 RepID=UPI00070BAC5F|nr:MULTISPECIES: DUF6328 family protein [unclassified Kitasatospora]KQV13241.1 hypothetical protein ASC99_08400 [Kitasatospora sp. Root107]KRB75311.1 hypothetical protein ASE03_15005 [Kitasatospora sp. Root187]
MAEQRKPPDSGRHETEEERADRRWSELLQEVRIAQTGAQIMFGFLLTVAFTERFVTLDDLERALYVTVVTLGAFAVGTLIAPVSYHRLLAGQHVKPRMVTAAAHLIALGLVLLAATISVALLLLLRVAGLGWAAWAIAAAVLLWFSLCWVLLPVAVLRRSKR